MRVINGVLGSALRLGSVPMNAPLTDAHPVPYSDRAPVLIAANSKEASTRAVRTIEASGLRIGDAIDIQSAPKRIERQAKASVVWVELDDDAGGPMDELLTQLNRDVAGGRYGAVVSAPAALVDAMIARLDHADVELIIDADDAERPVALALATTNKLGPARYGDVAADKNAARLRQLSDEVSRIAATLARLSTGPATTTRPAEPAPEK